MIGLLYRLALTPLATRRIGVLMYHQVLPDFDPMRPEEITAVQFDQQMSWVARHFNTFTLHEAMQRLAAGTLPRRALVVTFDDGYRDNYLTALPILQRHGVPATFFIASDYLDGGLMWNDRVIELFRQADLSALDLAPFGVDLPAQVSPQQRQQLAYRVRDKIKYLPFAQRHQVVDQLVQQHELPKDLMLSSEQVRALHRAGMEIGGHTCSHPILSSLEQDALRAEIGQNKARLETLLGVELLSFAYPNGKPEQDYNLQSKAMVKELGYRYAVTTSPGVVSRDADPLELARYTPWRRQQWAFLAQLARNYVRPSTELSH